MMGCNYSAKKDDGNIVSAKFKRKSTKSNIHNVNGELRTKGDNSIELSCKNNEENTEIQKISKEHDAKTVKFTNVGRFFSNKTVHTEIGKILPLSVDSVELADATEIELKSRFPIWREYDKCSICSKNESKDMSALSVDYVNITYRQTDKPVLCKACSRAQRLDTSIPNNQRSTASLLALTALDLSAPASDAVHKNRKNAWIQLAGHPGSFAPAGPRTIWKKRISKENYEMKAYQALMDSPTTRDLIPEFHREVEHNGEYFIEIEDLLQNFKDPNIMDIKMGKRTFLESEVKNPVLRKDLYEKMISVQALAPTEEERNQGAITKLRYMQFREEESSTSDLGFRVEAIRKSGEAPITNLKKVKTKNQVIHVMSQFFDGFTNPISEILTRLLTIREKFTESEFFKHHEIIGSSLLILYDKQGHSGVWMIDFAKTIPVGDNKVLYHNVPWQLGNHEDGFLDGLNSLVEIFEKLNDMKSQDIR